MDCKICKLVNASKFISSTFVLRDGSTWGSNFLLLVYCYGFVSAVNTTETRTCPLLVKVCLNTEGWRLLILIGLNDDGSHTVLMWTTVYTRPETPIPDPWSCLAGGMIRSKGVGCGGWSKVTDYVNWITNRFHISSSSVPASPLVET
jgi:hypothetical protein